MAPNESLPPTPQHKEFFLTVLDRLEKRIKLPPAPPLGATVVTDPTAREMNEKAEMLSAIAYLYQGVGEGERAKVLIADAARTAIAVKEVSEDRSRNEDGPGLGAMSAATSTAADRSLDKGSSGWAWIFAMVTTIAGTILGGVFKPILEAYGKGVVGKAFAEAMQSKEFAEALELKLSSVTPKQPKETTLPLDDSGR
jgi:hypothetical protein